MSKPKILVVEDDKAVRKLITMTIEAQGYTLRTAETGREALIETTSGRPDVMILDLGLPDMDGVEIIRSVRAWSNMPIIVVSARSESKDKVDALDAGADDYLTKPFMGDEFLARLRVSLRRVQYDSEKSSAESSVFKNGALKIDYAAGCVFIGDKQIHLSPNEYKLLCLLARNVDKVLTHRAIANDIWGSVYNDLPALRVTMTTLRRKIEKVPGGQPYIQTHVSIGYRMMRIPEE